MEAEDSSAGAPAALRNRYWILRHGRSVPNERGLIVSSLENGAKPEFGLAPQGVQQARAAGQLLRKELQEMGVPLDSVKIRYSPFSRTTETARMVAGEFGIPPEAPSFEVKQHASTRSATSSVVEVDIADICHGVHKSRGLYKRHRSPESLGILH
ncbi:hypothetical protein ACP4OV_029121 [Aristida adscensionis]